MKRTNSEGSQLHLKSTLGDILKLKRFLKFRINKYFCYLVKSKLST